MPTIRIMMHMITKNISTVERSAIISLSLIMSLRMIGLFMVLPLFVLYAEKLTGKTDVLMGIAIGIYGLSQALCQIPLGALSDRIGRKPVIFIGLLIFSVGCLLAGSALSIKQMIVGRLLQGAGAIGSTTLALLSDLTSEQSRTVSMAIIGMAIGLSFSLAMLLGPMLAKWFTFSALFYLAGLLGLFGMIILFVLTPSPPPILSHRMITPTFHDLGQLFMHRQLMILNSGIFTLHAIFTASFVIIPIRLAHFLHLAVHRQWLIYLPTLFIAFVIALLSIGIAERQRQIKSYLLGSIVMLGLSELGFWMLPTSAGLTALSLCAFFASFSILEALHPSLVSKIAPSHCKGSALGLYSCSQFLGIFAGGTIGGWLLGQFPSLGIFLFCITLSLIWLFLAIFIHPPYTQSKLILGETSWHAELTKSF